MGRDRDRQNQQRTTIAPVADAQTISDPLAAARVPPPPEATGDVGDEPLVETKADENAVIMPVNPLPTAPAKPAVRLPPRPVMRSRPLPRKPADRAVPLPMKFGDKDATKWRVVADQMVPVSVRGVLTHAYPDQIVTLSGHGLRAIEGMAKQGVVLEPVG